MNGEAIRIPVAPKFAAETTNNGSAGQLTAQSPRCRVSHRWTDRRVRSISTKKRHSLQCRKSRHDREESRGRHTLLHSLQFHVRAMRSLLLTPPKRECQAHLLQCGAACLLYSRKAKRSCESNYAGLSLVLFG